MRPVSGKWFIMYEIRLDTLKKRRCAPARPRMIVAFPFVIIKPPFHNFLRQNEYPPPVYTCVYSTIIADFSRNFKWFSEYFSPLFSQILLPLQALKAIKKQAVHLNKVNYLFNVIQYYLVFLILLVNISCGSSLLTAYLFLLQTTQRFQQLYQYQPPYLLKLWLLQLCRKTHHVLHRLFHPQQSPRLLPCLMPCLIACSRPCSIASSLA